MKSIFKIYGCCKTVIVEPSEYSDGATKINFPVEYSTEGEPIIYVEARIKDSIGLVSLPSITNRLRDEYNKAFGNSDVHIQLLLTYVPHARQDRYTGDNAFTFKYSALPLIVASNVDVVVVEDPHSNVCVDLLRAEGVQVEVLSQRSAMASSGILSELSLERYQYVIAPDAGSVDRAKDMARALNIPETNVICLTKHRDPDSGHISFEPYDSSMAYIKPEKVIMFDDIGDGCWTHILAAEALKAGGTKHVTLVLTHGIFSKGIDHLHPAIDQLIVVNDWRKDPFNVQILNSF